MSQDIIDRVTYDFGIPSRAVGEGNPQSEVLAKNWDPALPMPKITSSNDFWITSFAHLRTSWAGNTFADTKVESRDFHLNSGEVIQAAYLKSESTSYPYLHTDKLEAVQLSCWQASILFVLPAPGANVWERETALAKDPDLVEPQLARREGDVQMPTFQLSYEGNLRNSLEKMDVKRVFTIPATLLAMAPMLGGAFCEALHRRPRSLWTETESGLTQAQSLVACTEFWWCKSPFT